MNKKEILDIFEELEICSELDVIETKEDSNSVNYIIETPIEKYVLRKSKNRESSNRLKHESIVLKFLEKKGIDFAPKSVYYDKERDVHIIDFIEGELADVGQLSESQVIDLAKKISVLNHIKCEEFKEFSQQFEHESGCFESSLDILQRDIIEPFEYIERNCDDMKLVEKLRSIVKDIVINFRDYEEELYFIHGNIMNSLIVKGDNINLIDWIDADFKLTKGNEIVSIIKESQLRPEYEEKFVESYGKCSLYEPKKLDIKIVFEIKSHLVNEILVLGNKFINMKLKGDNWEIYYNEMNEKINIYEEKVKELKF